MHAVRKGVFAENEWLKHWLKHCFHLKTLIIWSLEVRNPVSLYRKIEIWEMSGLWWLFRLLLIANSSERMLNGLLSKMCS